MQTATTDTFFDSTPLLTTPDALRERAREDGYLFFKSRLPREAVMEVRAGFLEVLRSHGWICEDRPIAEGWANHEAIEKEDPVAMTDMGVGIHNQAYLQIQQLEVFHALSHRPELIAIYEALFGERVFPHPRNIARLMLPASFNKPTPAHQDFIHIQGTSNAWTCWVPMGDTPREMGNLTVLRTSHKKGLRTVGMAPGAGGLETHLCDGDDEWVIGDFEAGDVLTFPAYTVHKSLPAKVAERVRLSADFRYQPASEEIEAASLRVHGNLAPWEEIYQNWTRPELQYYWQNYNLPPSEWDDSIRWQRERICT